MHQPADRPADAPDRGADTVDVRLMTYNTHGCRGIDRIVAPQRIAEVIASAHPDLVALQELDAGRPRSANIHQAEAVARELGMDVQFFPSMHIQEEQYGNAILSRYPARLVRSALLPARGRIVAEPRGAIWSAIDLGAATLQLINTHLGLRGRERLGQAAELMRWLRDTACAPPVVIAGDLNAAPGTRSYRLLSGALTDAQRVGGRRPRATFPTRFPTLRLDHVFVSPDIEVLAADTVRTPLARFASDHFPVVSELRIRRRTAIARADRSRDAAAMPVA